MGIQESTKPHRAFIFGRKASREDCDTIEEWVCWHAASTYRRILAQFAEAVHTMSVYCCSCTKL